MTTAMWVGFGVIAVVVLFVVVALMGGDDSEGGGGTKPGSDFPTDKA